jgi:hypothetical protein
MPLPLNLIDRVFNRLTVIEKSISSPQGTRWLCKCECGNTTIVLGKKLINQHTQSCGCFKKEWASINKITHGLTKKGDKTNRALHGIWCQMRNRCEDPTNPAYKDYGGRGITVCERWQTFIHFFNDMGKRPSIKHSIERQDNNAGYYPDNCYWATMWEQAANRRNNTSITFEGKTQHLSAWAREKGLATNTLSMRIKEYNWPIEKALNTPSKKL